MKEEKFNWTEFFLSYGWIILLACAVIGSIIWFGIHPLMTTNKCEEIAKLDYNMSKVAYCYILNNECVCAEDKGTQIQKEHSTQIIHQAGESVTFKIK